jgi:apolipoprotein N-acyltransferase
MLLLGRIAAAVLSGLLLAQSYGLQPFWPLAWIAPIPLLIAVIGATRLGALLYGALAGALSMVLFFPYLMELSGPVVPSVILLIKALMWGGICFAVRGAPRHLPTLAAVFVYPLLMAGIETVIATTSPHGSASSLAYSQMDFLPAIQVASLGGAPAITFVLSAFASFIAFLVARRAIFSAIAPLLLVSAAIAWGFMRPVEVTSPNTDQLITVAMLAGDNLDHDAADWRATWEEYVDEAGFAADRGARIIVLPEKIVTIPEGEAEEALAPLSEIARSYNSIIVVGATVVEGGQRYNRAYFITPDGVRAYDKQHMIPGLESDLTPGTATLFTDVGGVRMGVLICKDMDFPALSRRYGEQDVALMLVPAWDFGSDAWLHSRMAVLRGVEGGFTIIRSAREGVMTTSTPYGRVVDEARSGSDIVTRQAILLPPRHVPTLYVRIGDTFGWLCVALSVFLIGWMILARRRAGQGG